MIVFFILLFSCLKNNLKKSFYKTGNSNEPQKSINFVETLCTNGFNLNRPNRDGNTLLHLSISYNNIHMVNALIANNANFNLQNSYGETPLHIAARFGRIECVICLINNGADVNILNIDGHHALHVAIINKNFNICKELLNLTDLSILDENENTLLHIAVKDRILLEIESEELYYKFLKNIASNSSLILRRKFLELLATKNRNSLLLIILCQFINEIASHKTNIPSEHINFIRQLIQVVPDINAKNANKETPLHLASNVKIAEFLIQNGANINTKDEIGQPALHLAVLAENFPLINLLLLNGANVNKRDNSGSTALHIASRKNNLAIIRRLINFGADINIMNNYGVAAHYM